MGVEVVGFWVVVGGGGNDDVVGTSIGVLLVEAGPEIEGLVLQEVFDVGVFDGALLGVEHCHFTGHDVNGHHFIMLGQQHGVAQAYVAGACDGDFHAYSTLTLTV